MIVVDGNDGTGKSTLKRALERELGFAFFRVLDRGLPTRMTDDDALQPGEKDAENLHIILDAPTVVSRARLAQAGKDLNEKWHTVESLEHYRVKFQEVAARLGKLAVVIDADRPEDAVLRDAIRAIYREDTRVLGEAGRIKRGARTRIGVPKGRLFATASEIVARADHHADFRVRIDDILDRSLHRSGLHGDYTLLKARSIPDLVGLGMIDIGLVGQDLIEESVYADELVVRPLISAPVDEIRVLHLASAPVDEVCVRVSRLPGRTAAVTVNDVLPTHRPVSIATEYPRIASRWAAKGGLAHVIVQTYGSTEAYVPALCDIALDVVETGDTARANGLVVGETVFRSQLSVVYRKGSHAAHTDIAHLMQEGPCR